MVKVATDVLNRQEKEEMIRKSKAIEDYTVLNTLGLFRLPHSLSTLTAIPISQRSHSRRPPRQALDPMALSN